MEGDGAEAVVPLEQNTGWIRKVAEQMNGEMGSSGNLEALLEQIIRIYEQFFPQFGKGQIVLDTGTLVGQLAPEIDYQIGVIQKRSIREGGSDHRNY